MLLARVYLVNNSSNHIFGFLCVSHFSKWLNSSWSFVESSLGCSGVFFFFFFSLEIAFFRPLLCMSQPSQPSNDLWISWRIIFLVPNRQNYSPHHASSCTRFISDFFHVQRLRCVLPQQAWWILLPLAMCCCSFPISFHLVYIDSAHWV